MPWRSFEKISILYLRFLPEFRCSNIFAVTEQTRNQIFLVSYKKNVLTKIFTLVLLDDFQMVFQNFDYFLSKFACLLGDFRKLQHARACRAYVETILSHTEHTRKRFHHTLSIRGTNFCACSASGKMYMYCTCTYIHAEHKRNEFHRTLSIRGTNFIAG